MAQLLTDAQVRAALLLLNGARVDLRRRPRRQPPTPLKLIRTCTDCGLTLPLQAFVRILWNRPRFARRKSTECKFGGNTFHIPQN